jgi:N-acetylglucosamine-6-phosphate deacetylase
MMRHDDRAAPTQVLRGRIVTGGRIYDDGLLIMEGDRITYCGSAGEYPREQFSRPVDIPPSSETTILPGFVDIHCHGASGGEFPSGAEESARRAITFLHSRGTTTLLASLVTASPNSLIGAVRNQKLLADEGLLAGIHLEGPFLAHSHCGAHDPNLLMAPDLNLAEALLNAADGYLKTMTYAAELPGAPELVDLLARHGVIPSLGHTGAGTDTAAASLARARMSLAAAGYQGYRGRPTVTHLFNGMPPMHHRSPGPVAACLREARAGNVTVELIADGTHLDPQMVRTVFELVGAENIVLVTDSMAAAGLSDGHYALGGSAVTVSEGRATKDSTGGLAGGTATMLDVVRGTVRAGVPLQVAVESATSVPAAVLGLSAEVGSLRAGLRADVVIVDDSLALLGVLRAGQWLTALPYA